MFLPTPPGGTWLAVAPDLTVNTFVPVSVQVSDSPILGVPAQSLSFTTQTGVESVMPQQIAVNSVWSPTPFQATTYGGSWLTASPTTNATTNVSVATTGLAAGYLHSVWLRSKFREWPTLSNQCPWRSPPPRGF